MSISKRVRDLENRGGPNGCGECGGYFAVRVNGKLDSLTRHGKPCDEGERAVYLARERAMAENGGKCPACGLRHIEITILGLARTEP